jgi:hypothetical protein
MNASKNILTGRKHLQAWAGGLAAALVLVFAAPASADPSWFKDGGGATSKPVTEKQGATKKPTTTKTTTKKKKKRSAQTVKTKRTKGRDGAYIQGGLGVSTITSEPSGVDLEGGTIGQIGVGYRLTPDLAVEGSLMAQFHDVLLDSGDQDQAAERSLMGVQVGLKYHFPIMAPRIEGFAEADLGYLGLDSGDTRDEISGLTLGGAIGADYRLTKEFAMGAKAGYMTTLDDAQGDDLGVLSLMLTAGFQF